MSPTKAATEGQKLPRRGNARKFSVVEFQKSVPPINIFIRHARHSVNWVVNNRALITRSLERPHAPTKARSGVLSRRGESVRECDAPQGPLAGSLRGENAEALQGVGRGRSGRKAASQGPSRGGWAVRRPFGEVQHRSSEKKR